jgi:DNA-directed RNA polymerase specialized sigma subunit
MLAAHQLYMTNQPTKEEMIINLLNQKELRRKYTVTAIAKMVGVSRQWVYQIIAKNRDKLGLDKA